MTKSGKHCGKRRNCTMFSKSRLLQRASESVYMRERVKLDGKNVEAYELKCLLQICCMWGRVNFASNTLFEFNMC